MTVGRLTLGDADIAKILLTIAEHQQRLADPSYAKKLREDIMTIPDEKKAQMDAADTLLVKAASMKAEIKKQQDEANEQLAQRERAVKVREATMEQLNERKKEVEILLERNKIERENLKKKEDELFAISAKHKDIENIHVRTKASLDKQKDDLDTYAASLTATAKELQVYEAEINETAAQMQGDRKSVV